MNFSYGAWFCLPSEPAPAFNWWLNWSYARSSRRGNGPSSKRRVIVSESFGVRLLLSTYYDTIGGGFLLSGALLCVPTEPFTVYWKTLLFFKKKQKKGFPPPCGAHGHNLGEGNNEPVAQNPTTTFWICLKRARQSPSDMLQLSPFCYGIATVIICLIFEHPEGQIAPFTDPTTDLV